MNFAIADLLDSAMGLDDEYLMDPEGTETMEQVFVSVGDEPSLEDVLSSSGHVTGVM